jgi:hypothetical protein
MDQWLFFHVCTMVLIWSFVQGAAGLANNQKKYTYKMPTKREWLPLPASLDVDEDSLVVRVQQFNVLADGLSGLRPDFGES